MASDADRSKWSIPILTAVIGACATIYAVHRSSTLDERKMLLEQQQMELQSQSEAQKNAEAQAEQDTQNKKLLLDDLAQHDADVNKMAAQIGDAKWSIEFKNTCTAPINLAVEYTALDSKRVVTGWFRIEPGETIHERTATRTFFYLYKNPNGQFPGVLEGDHSLNVTSSAFRYLLDDLYNQGLVHLKDEKTQSFKKGQITSTTWGTFEQDLPCPPARTGKQFPAFPATPRH